MKHKHGKIIFAILLGILIYPTICFSEWIGPVEIAQGAWGKDASEFGIQPNATYDSFPRLFYIKKNGQVIIEDVLQKNGRMKTYDNGKLLKITKCKRIKDDEWNEECNILGDYVYTDIDESIWTTSFDENKKKTIYKKYTASGILLRTTEVRPVELGKYDRVNNTITLPNQTTTIPKQRYSPDHTHDHYGNVYLYENKKVVKYDSSGKKVGTLTINENIYQYGKDDRGYFFAEYGTPIVGPYGSIYTWKRTPESYSILRWSWVNKSK